MATGEKGCAVPPSSIVTMMTEGRCGTAGTGAGVGFVPFGASASGFRHQGIASTYTGVTVPEPIRDALNRMSRR